MIESDILAEVLAHARQQMPRESCGVIVVFKGRYKYFPCRNEASGTNEFSINPEDYAHAEDLGEIVYVVHSHPNTPNKPSAVDLVNIEKTNLPWLIVNPHNGEYTVTQPSGYVVPLIGRQFFPGVLDCYTIIRDYYQQTLNITIPDWPREDNWWLTGQNLYIEGYPQSGFVSIETMTIKPHDVVLMNMGSSVVNHAGIILPDQTLLHHARGRLSSRDVYSGYYRNITSHVLRHKELL